MNGMNERIRDGDFGGLDITTDADEQNNSVNPREVNRLLSDELNQLSLDHRERVLEEIHGVKTGGDVSLQSSSGVNNQLTRLQQEEIALEKFQEELDKYYFYQTRQIATHSFGRNLDNRTNRNCRYTAYRYARENGSELINDRDFRLTFFGRGEGGNCPKKAARRMLNYLELIREIYDSDDVLFRPICLSDLKEDAGSKEFIYEKAPLQILPVRDPSGRRVFVHVRDFGPSSCSVLVRQQVGMYFIQSMIEDRDGMIFVYFFHHADRNIYHAEEIQNFNRMMEALPPKFSAIHLCCPECQLYEIAKAAFTLLIGKENRERLRIHVGSYQECKYALQQFGIPVSRFPIELESKGKNSKVKKFDLKYHKKWLAMREAKERAMLAAIERDERGRIINSVNDNHLGMGNSFCGVMAAAREIRLKFVECPRHEDCLFGKGRPAMYHPGNIAMRRLLEAKIGRFEAMMPSQKSRVVWEVVNEIKRGTGRFLKEDTDHGGIFVITDDKTAFKKISIAFRDLRKRRLRIGEQSKAVGDSKESQCVKKTNVMTPTLIGTKRPASSAKEPSSKEFSLERTMNVVLGKKLNVGKHCFPSFAANCTADTVSKHRKDFACNDIL